MLAVSFRVTRTLYSPYLSRSSTVSVVKSSASRISITLLRSHFSMNQTLALAFIHQSALPKVRGMYIERRHGDTARPRNPVDKDQRCTLSSISMRHLSVSLPHISLGWPGKVNSPTS